MANGGRREEIFAQVKTTLDTLASGAPGNGFNFNYPFITRDVVPLDLLNATQLPALQIFDEGAGAPNFNFEQTFIESECEFSVVVVVQARANLPTAVNKALEDVRRKLTADLTLNNLVVSLQPRGIDGVDLSMAHDFLGYAKHQFLVRYTHANDEL